MKARKHQHVYGPVPSRRLGLSLGVDLVPFKVCPLDCTYCQVGRTTVHTTDRGVYIPAEEILAELQAVLDTGIRADYITLSGSGEPTLHAELGRIIASIKQMTEIPLAVLTNSTLLGDPKVREALLPADLIVPSLDAGDEATFAAVNRPCAGVTLASVVEGLKALRREYTGQIRLEVLLVAGLNDRDDQIAAIKAVADEIAPDAIELNTVTRPPADAEAEGASLETLLRARTILGPKARIVPLHSGEGAATGGVSADDVLAMVSRRPCTLADLAAGLGCTRSDAERIVAALVSEGKIDRRLQDNRTYYQTRDGE